MSVFYSRRQQAGVTPKNPEKANGVYIIKALQIEGFRKEKGECIHYGKYKNDDKNDKNRE